MRSIDDGVNWENAALSLENRTRFPSQLFDLAFHPENPDILYVGTKSSGLWKSVNNGASWQKTKDRSGTLDPKADVFRVAISQSRPSTMYLAVFQNRRGRVLKSEDSGETFQQIYTVTADGFGIFDVYLDPRNEKHAFIATGQGGVLETQNGGTSWKVKKWFNDPIVRLYLNPLTTDEIYVQSRDDQLLKSFNGGNEWISLQVSARAEPAPLTYPPREGIFRPLSGTKSSSLVLTLDPRTPSTLYAGTPQGVLRSLDGGFNWTLLDIAVPPESLPITTLAVHPRNSSVLFMGAGKELYQTRDAGEHWSISTLPAKTRIHKLFIHPQRPENMLVFLER